MAAEACGHLGVNPICDPSESDLAEFGGSTKALVLLDSAFEGMLTAMGQKPANKKHKVRTLST